MRKLASILLLIVFIFYHLGYYGLYLVISHQLDQSWNVKVYGERVVNENLLHTAIPLSIPYQPDQQEYQPHSGKLEIDGQYYRIVKQRYASDTLHIIYVNDPLQAELDQSINEWLASIIQKPSSTDHQGTQLWKMLAKDFVIDEFWVLVEPQRLLASLPYAPSEEAKYDYIDIVSTPPPQL